jgi:hypothetical protein
MNIGRLLAREVPAIAVGLDTLEEMTSPPVGPADPSRIVGGLRPGERGASPWGVRKGW